MLFWPSSPFIPASSSTPEKRWILMFSLGIPVLIPWPYRATTVMLFWVTVKAP